MSSDNVFHSGPVEDIDPQAHYDEAMAEYSTDGGGTYLIEEYASNGTVPHPAPHTAAALASTARTGAGMLADMLDRQPHALLYAKDAELVAKELALLAFYVSQAACSLGEWIALQVKQGVFTDPDAAVGKLAQAGLAFKDAKDAMQAVKWPQDTGNGPTLTAQWITAEVTRLLREAGVPVADPEVQPNAVQWSFPDGLVLELMGDDGLMRGWHMLRYDPDQPGMLVSARAGADLPSEAFTHPAVIARQVAAWYHKRQEGGTGDAG